MLEVIRVVLRESAWRERRIRTGEIVTHTRFVDFITRPPLEGLGEKPDRIKKLLRDDLEALAAFEAAIVGKPGNRTGANQYKDGGISDNITSSTPQSERGTSRAYTLRRLAKDHPALFAKVTGGELSMHCGKKAAARRGAGRG